MNLFFSLSLLLIAAVFSHTKAVSNIAILSNSGSGSVTWRANIVAKIYSGCLQYTGSDSSRCTVKNVTAADENTVGNFVSSNSQFSVFILCGSDFKNASNQVPSKFSSKSFILMDSRSDSVSSNLISVDFSTDQIGYIAGAIAGILTTSENVGVFAPSPLKDVQKYINGFKNGVILVCSKCNVFQQIYNKTESISLYNASVAEFIQTKSIDVLFSVVRNDSTPAVYQYANSQNVTTIGADLDFGSFLYASKNSTGFSKYGASVVKNYSSATFMALSGSFSSTPPTQATARVQNGGIALGAFPSNSLWNNSNPAQMLVEPRFNLSNGICPIQTPVTRSQYMLDVVLNIVSENLASGVNFSSAYSLDIETASNNTFVITYPFGSRPPALSYHSFTVGRDNQMYTFGGVLNGATQTNRMWKLDFNMLEWSEVDYSEQAVVPDIREGHAAMFYGKFLYIFGGMQGTKTFCDLWKFDPSEVVWTQITLSTTICRGYSAYAKLEESLFLFGGYDETYQIVNSLIRIDVLSGKVYTYEAIFPSGNLQYGLLQSMMVITESKELFLFGGNNDNVGRSSIMYKFIFENSTWVLPPASGAIYAMSGGIMNQISATKLLITGGRDGNGATNYNFLYNIQEGVFDWENAQFMTTASEQMAGFAFNLSSNSCRLWDNALYTLCPQEGRTMLIFFGGRDSTSYPVSDLNIYRIGTTGKLTSCPKGEYITEDKYERNVCVECPSTTYNNNENVATCASCPLGGICPGGSVVKVKQYHWQDKTSFLSGNPPQIYPCPKEINTCCQSVDGCTVEEQCKEGTTGPLCAQCSDPDHFIWVSKCVACKTATAGYFVGLVTIAVIISLIILFTLRFHGVFISNLVFSYQVLALVVSDDSKRDVIASMTSLNAQVLLQQTRFSPCFAPLNGLGKAWLRVALSLLLPVVFLLMALFIKVLSKYTLTSKIVYKTARSKMNIDIVAALIFISQLIFLPLINAVMTFFSCKTTVVDSKSVQLLKQFPDVECFKSGHLASTFILAITLIIFCGALPAWFAYVLYKTKKEKNDKEKENGIIQYITSPYKKNYYYWLYLEYFERGFLGSVAIFYSRNDDNYSWTMFVAITFLLILQQVTAYFFEKESWSKLILMLSMLGVAGLGIMNSQPCAMDDCSGLLTANDKWENLWLILPLFLTIYRVFEKTINHVLALLFSKLKIIEAPVEKHHEEENHTDDVNDKHDGKPSSVPASQPVPVIKTTTEIISNDQ